MDYEKKYKDALERAKEIIECSKSDTKEVRMVLSFFPELKESEDDGMVKFIKKQLFNIKKTITDNYELDTELTKAIDWLEKQGEQKPAEWSEDYERYISYILTNCMHYAEETGYVEEKNNSIIHQQAKDWLKNKLKSLRHQNAWKPTEQQMKVLNEVINFAADHGTMRWNDYIYNVLKGLREQLKIL